MLLAGDTYPKIAKTLKVCNNTISTVAAQEGIIRRAGRPRKLPPAPKKTLTKERRPLTKEENEQRLELYRQGLTDRAIGQIVGITQNGVRNWRNRMKLQANYGRNGRKPIRRKPTDEKYELTEKQQKIKERFLPELHYYYSLAEENNTEFKVMKFLKYYRNCIKEGDVVNETKQKNQE